MPPDPHFMDQKWNLEMWEHEEGKSRAEKEFSNLARTNPKGFAEILEKIRFLQDTSLETLIQTQYIKKIKNGKNLHEIRFLKAVNGRFIGVIIERPLSKPTFYALLFFDKKTNNLPPKILDTALDRLKEFNQTQNEL
jgi:phage-related protein